MATQFLKSTDTHSDIIRPLGKTMVQVNPSSAAQRFVLQQARAELSDAELAHADNAGEWADMTARTDALAFSQTRRTEVVEMSKGFAYRLFRYEGSAGATAYHAAISTWTRRMPGTR